jgi:hypothetical protein
MRQGAPRRIPGVAPALAAAAPVAALVSVALLTSVGAGTARAQGGWWKPPQHLTWYWQLQGTVNNAEPVAAYDIDGFENSAAEVMALHGQGKRVICYIDVGTAEEWRPDYSEFPKSVLGRSNGWPGERWLDIRQLSVLEPIMAARFQMCREKGFDAVEPDNIEGYANKTGFPLTAAEQLTYNEWVADEVHSLGMAVLQKNDSEQTPELMPYFDGALSEQCNQYKECASFEPYLAAGEPVLDAEYPPEDQEVLRCRRSRGDHGRALRPRAQRQALRTLLLSGATGAAGAGRIPSSLCQSSTRTRRRSAPSCRISLQGNVSEPAACSVDPESANSTGSVSRLEAPWMSKTPVTGTWTSAPELALTGNATGLESTNVAVGKRLLSSPISWIFSSRIERSLLSVLTAASNEAAVIVKLPLALVTIAAPVTSEVRPTASLSAGRKASFSRTR